MVRELFDATEEGLSQVQIEVRLVPVSLYTTADRYEQAFDIKTQNALQLWRREGFVPGPRLANNVILRQPMLRGATLPRNFSPRFAQISYSAVPISSLACLVWLKLCRHFATPCDSILFDTTAAKELKSESGTLDLRRAQCCMRFGARGVIEYDLLTFAMVTTSRLAPSA